MVIREEDEQWDVPQLVGRPISQLSHMALQIVAMVVAHGLSACNGGTNSDQERTPTFRRGHQRNVIVYILLDVQLWTDLVDMEVLNTTESDHRPLAVRLKGGKCVRSPNWGLSDLPEPSFSNNQRQVTWPRVLADREENAEIYQCFIRVLDEFEELHVDPNLFLQTHDLLFDKLKLIFSSEYRGSLRSGAKHPHWFNQDCRMAKWALVTAIRECNRADIKYARAMYKKAQRVARKERDDESWQKLLKALKLRDNHAFCAIISDGAGELGTLSRCNIAPDKWEEHFGALYPVSVNYKGDVSGSTPYQHTGSPLADLNIALGRRTLV
ncbi:hypothetical protein NDU88_009131 [Pleurodeles waltl]|uniref:Reverse transcriptase n=1 Tax=Pleurodeles waltl TaxID=8319 RepID=A0AAV7QWJ1_PLEWA|nr:hypothetical protein NDU88_009131 [Pleurodeles waltl]